MTPERTPLTLNPPTDEFQGEELAPIRAALLRYRLVAWIVGVLLILLVCVAVPLKYLRHNDSLVTWIGMPHGWLYMLLLITTYDLGRRVHWSWQRMATIAVSGLVPFATFVAEWYATRNVQQRLKTAELMRARPQ